MILPTRNDANLCVESTLNNIVKKLASISDAELNTPPAKRIKSILNKTPLLDVLHDEEDLVLASLPFENNLILNIERDKKTIELIHKHLEEFENLDHLSVYQYFVANSASLATQNLDFDIPENAHQLYCSLGHQVYMGDRMIYIFRLKQESKARLKIHELAPEQANESDCAYSIVYDCVWETMINTLMATLHLAFKNTSEIHTSLTEVKKAATKIKSELENAFSKKLSKNKILNVIANELGFVNGFTAIKNHQRLRNVVEYDINKIHSLLYTIEREARTLLELSHNQLELPTELHEILADVCVFYQQNPQKNKVFLKDIEHNANDTRLINYISCLVLYCASISGHTQENERTLTLTKTLTEYNQQIFALQRAFII